MAKSVCKLELLIVQIKFMGNIFYSYDISQHEIFAIFHSYNIQIMSAPHQITAISPL